MFKQSLSRTAATFFLIGSLITPSFARDYVNGSVESLWKDLDPALVAWFQSLKMPDTNQSCCGEADAYWADSYYIEPVTKQWYAIVTDTRPDEPRGRKHIPVGTKVPVPNHKLYGRPKNPDNPTDVSNNPGNPTGHGIIFINPVAVEDLIAGQKIIDNEIEASSHKVVYCYIQPGGI